MVAKGTPQMAVFRRKEHSHHSLAAKLSNETVGFQRNDGLPTECGVSVRCTFSVACQDLQTDILFYEFCGHSDIVT